MHFGSDMQPGVSGKDIKGCTDNSTFVHSCQDQDAFIFSSRGFFSIIRTKMEWETQVNSYSSSLYKMHTHNLECLFTYLNGVKILA